MFGVCELARRNRFEPGDEQDYDAAEHENDLWWFQIQISRPWDALLEALSAEDRWLTVRSIRFIIDRIQIERVECYVSYLHLGSLAVKTSRLISLVMMREQSRSHGGRSASACWHKPSYLASRVYRHVRCCIRLVLHNDGHKDDFTCVAIFLSELDLRAKLPMTTNELEMKLLRTIPQACDFGQIINNFQNVDSWLIKSALERLISDRLVTLDMNMVPARYSITEAGFALVGAA